MFPSMDIPVQDCDREMQSLQSATRHFISPEAYRLHKASLANADNTSDVNRPVNSLRQITPRGATARMNVLDYLAWLNLSMRLLSSQKAAFACRTAELASEAITEADRQAYGESQVPFDSDLERMLMSLPNVDYPPSGAVMALLGRAAVIESQVNNLLHGQLPRTITSMESFSRETSLHPPSLMPPRTTKEEMQPFARLRFNASGLMNLMFGGRIDEDKDAKPSVPLDNTLLPPVAQTFRSVSIFSPKRSEKVRSIGIPQSLLDRKFAGEDGAPPEASTSSSLPTLKQNPHHDYRIVHSQAVRDRARVVFAQPVLAEPSVKPWCDAHRVQACSLCTADPEQYPALHRRSLAECLEEFLIFSADCFSLLASGYQSPAGSAPPSRRPSFSGTPDGESHRDPINFAPTPAWYELVVSCVTQACLNGYLSHSWVGKEPIEILFGMGCGVWEGRAWGEGVDLSTKTDREKRLYEACRKLFGCRNPAQAEYEREMRDRTHEFLNLEDRSLAEHLAHLNARYPVSASAELMFGFWSAVQRFIGLPKLAKYGQQIRPGQSAHNLSALEAYVSRFPQYEADRDVAPMQPSDSRKRPSSINGEPSAKKIAL